MDPPSYEEARFNPPIQTVCSRPPPAYDASLASPPTPPPAYRDAVTSPSNPFPVLTPPSLGPVEPATHHPNGVIVHPVTQVGAPQRTHRAHSLPSAVVTQPGPVPIRVSCLRDFPALVQCPHCQRTVTTKVKFVPGSSAWCMCVLLGLTGVLCGCCLIPLCVRSMQDAHHYCPHCGEPLHVYKS
ncbi:lipopolysaccharide-induced tumor necrosis factor-alpha factor homolog [Salarias fasciatus]|uniref:Lipopolysaccharide-induced tumor necrosis factor-alpha factor homolog n=1 Tax=Salarias fasciatus TaxID=181472 RepID=A0A672H0N1_SALFA|nr:lipopolysaccharide-induced tumor necrosis factor-alpha factor homolog [Salarias fasciatus]